MFREMREVGAPLSKEETEAMLQTQRYGTLAVLGDEGYPYAVPIYFVYENDCIFFHCATSGHKLDSIKKEPKVSFSVTEKDDLIPEEFNTLYRSAIAFGKAEILTNDDEKRTALRKIIGKYSPGFEESGDNYITASWDDVTAVKVTIEHLTGKKGTN